MSARTKVLLVFLFVKKNILNLEIKLKHLQIDDYLKKIIVAKRTFNAHNDS
jgi:hypothetical protein